MPIMHIANKDGRIYNYPILKDEITIGRGKDNDIVLADSTVSRNHAKIIKAKKDYRLIDLGSFNGTKVNEKSIHNAILRHDDLIRIGFTKLIFLTKEKYQSPVAESIILIPETEDEKDDQKIVQSSPSD